MGCGSRCPPLLHHLLSNLADPRFSVVLSARGGDPGRPRARSPRAAGATTRPGSTSPASTTSRATSPVELLGDDSAPNPRELLLAALASCTIVGFVAGATAEGFRIDALSIDTELALDLRGAFGLDPAIPAGAERIKYTIRVRGSATPAQFEEIHQRTLANWPNYFHLSRPISFDSQLVVD
jgi:uncharacterized OsmC-like protein